MRKYILLLIPLLIGGCTPGLVNQGRKMVETQNYDQAIQLYYQEIANNPTNLIAWRELGIAYYKSGDMTKAEDALKKANKADPGTHLYLGLVLETQGNYDHAIKSYAAALKLEPGGQTDKLVRAHLDELIQKKLSSEVSNALQSEAAIDAASIPKNTIAVANFDGSNLDPRMAPIARGLAELTAADLAKVESLQVVERLKIDYLLKELELGSSGLSDPAQAPRIGRLLGSNRVVTGSALSVGEEGIRIDGAVVSTTDSTIKIAEPQEGELAKLFEVQRNFVFGVIDDMGITLTASERDAIHTVPTESHLAFMAYCRGLDYRSRGMLGSAQQEFQQALGHDQNFSEASGQMQAVNNSLARMQVGDVSPQQLETVVGAELGMMSQANAQGLTTILNNAGLIPHGSGRTNTDADKDPVVGGTGAVVIKGDLDGN